MAYCLVEVRLDSWDTKAKRIIGTSSHLATTESNEKYNHYGCYLLVKYYVTKGTKLLNQSGGQLKHRFPRIYGNLNKPCPLALTLKSVIYCHKSLAPCFTCNYNLLVYIILTK